MNTHPCTQGLLLVEGDGPWLIDHRSGRLPRGYRVSVQPLSLHVPEPPSAELSELPNIGELKRQAVNYKCFGQFDKDVTAVLSGAREYVESYLQLVAGNETKLAMLDIDETALSNWPVIRGDDFAFIKKGDCGDLSKEEFCGWVS
jgi:hypothetical protein